jgi:hypothetical protein
VAREDLSEELTPEMGVKWKSKRAQGGEPVEGAGQKERVLGIDYDQGTLYECLKIA